MGGRTVCNLCAPGTFQSSVQATSCDFCLAGTFSNQQGVITCDSCSPGFVSPHAGATVCLSCDENTYADEAGSSKCEPCDAGFSSVGHKRLRCYPVYWAAGTLSAIAVMCLLLILGMVAMFVTLAVSILFRRLKSNRLMLHSLLAKLERGEMRADLALRWEEIQFGELIGRGGSGAVYRALWRDITVAVKVIRLAQGQVEKASHSGEDMSVVQEKFKLELRLLSSLHHPNIILLLGACTENNDHLCIVTEYMDKGCLYDYLRQLRKPLRLQEKLDILGQAARGCCFLHSRNVVHRDLKSLNLLLDSRKNVKICDFGLSRPISDQDDTDDLGSIAWCAPEVLARREYSKASDVYSFGIIAWEVISCEELYPHISQLRLTVAVVEGGIRPPIPGNCPLSLAELMTRAWSPTVESRPTFSEIEDSIYQLYVNLGLEGSLPRNYQKPASIRTPRSMLDSLDDVDEMSESLLYNM